MALGGGGFLSPPWPPSPAPALRSSPNGSGLGRDSNALAGPASWTPAATPVGRLLPRLARYATAARVPRTRLRVCKDGAPTAPPGSVLAKSPRCPAPPPPPPRCPAATPVHLFHREFATHLHRESARLCSGSSRLAPPARCGPLATPRPAELRRPGGGSASRHPAGTGQLGAARGQRRPHRGPAESAPRRHGPVNEDAGRGRAPAPGRHRDGVVPPGAPRT